MKHESPKTAHTSEVVVDVRACTKIYHQGEASIHAVDNVSLSVRRGEFTVLVGPSGSGKTTLLNLIGALDAPDKGTLAIEGRDLGALSRSQLALLRRDRIGFVFQAYNLIPVLSAAENTEFVLALQGQPPTKRRARALDVLKAVGLEGYQARRPNQLSGGQQQRVAIARAIAPSPAIVLADEPTANVDSETGERLLDLMEALNRNEHATFLFSTHDPRVVARAKRIITMKDGRVVADTTVPPDAHQGPPAPC
ncbi:MAG: ABC transporter ATP-binding protein [Deltaproteobacteria bacterium]|nr:ABC transporter ATP-binding protein [Deltaproteobacteria bacterium]